MSASRAYFLNAGAYDHEEEVLLYDGVDLIVVSVEIVLNRECEMLYTLITL